MGIAPAEGSAAGHWTVQVDLAVAIESFIHCANPDRFMSEAASVLRSGGRLVLCDDFLAAPALDAGPRTRALLATLQRSGSA